MGSPILESVLHCLEEAGFFAIAAYPGQKFSQIVGLVAAYHLHKVDTGSRTATVEVTVFCPADLGGSACEAAALKATTALQAIGAACVQNGCAFDGIHRLYSVSILATFVGIPEGTDCTMGNGFYIQLNDVYQPWAVSFTEEKVQEQTPEFATRSPVGVTITPGHYYWKIQMEELVSPGFQETAEPAGEFQLRLVQGDRSQLFHPCRWTSVTRSLSPEGLRRIRKGIALMREEEA